MERERNILQKKKQENTLEKERNETEINMPDEEFKEMILKILTALEKRVEENK